MDFLNDKIKSMYLKYLTVDLFHRFTVWWIWQWLDNIKDQM